MGAIQELSKKCGVSISTVSKALNGYSDISERTRELVINYIGKEAAKKLIHIIEHGKVLSLIQWR